MEHRISLILSRLLFLLFGAYHALNGSFVAYIYQEIAGVMRLKRLRALEARSWTAVTIWLSKPQKSIWLM